MEREYYRPYTLFANIAFRSDSTVYQFSETIWTWKERFAERQEIADYARHLSDLRKNIAFNTRITEAVWNDVDHHWVTYVDAGTEKPVFATASFVVLCTGYTGQKHVPEIKGLETFGRAFHTADWTSDIVTEGKRVAVIARTTRCHAFASDAGDRNLEATPSRPRTPHLTPTGLNLVPLPRDTFDDTPERRRQTYESTWAKGGQHFWFGNYRDLLENRPENREAYNFWRDKTRARIQDPAKWEILAPTRPPYAFGTKRPALESRYFESFNRDNVTLVDLNRDEIMEITPAGVRTVSGQFHALELIVLATGYEVGIGSQLAIAIHGRHGVSLQEKWYSSKGVATHLGMITAGFPNLFFVCGPQSPTAFAVAPRVVELQVDFLVKRLAGCLKQGRTIDTTAIAEGSWATEVDESAKKTLIPETVGWYMRKGKPLFYIGGLPAYQASIDAAMEDSSLSLAGTVRHAPD
ncbi:hypothetical protein LTR41_011392 [Exophiala xenobiotica]|nr:hypothetical protein LTR41_011392 [Exophiala xenobiotica]KAK5550509.1 hypothetical protein LTR46_011489 [Exophiala xenobiotica]